MWCAVSAPLDGGCEPHLNLPSDLSSDGMRRVAISGVARHDVRALAGRIGGVWYAMSSYIARHRYPGLALGRLVGPDEGNLAVFIVSSLRNRRVACSRPPNFLSEDA